VKNATGLRASAQCRGRRVRGAEAASACSTRGPLQQTRLSFTENASFLIFARAELPCKKNNVAGTL